jgi:hypothetical protein
MLSQRGDTIPPGSQVVRGQLEGITAGRDKVSCLTGDKVCNLAAEKVSSELPASWISLCRGSILQEDSRFSFFVAGRRRSHFQAQ